jgi:hypothetical protein
MGDEDSGTGNEYEGWVRVPGGSDERANRVSPEEYAEMCKPGGGGGSGCLISLLEIMAGGAALSYPVYEGIRYLVG